MRAPADDCAKPRSSGPLTRFREAGWHVGALRDQLARRCILAPSAQDHASGRPALDIALVSGNSPAAEGRGPGDQPTCPETLLKQF